MPQSLSDNRSPWATGWEGHSQDSMTTGSVGPQCAGGRRGGSGTGGAAQYAAAAGARSCEGAAHRQGCELLAPAHGGEPCTLFCCAPPVACNRLQMQEGQSTAGRCQQPYSNSDRLPSVVYLVHLVESFTENVCWLVGVQNWRRWSWCRWRLRTATSCCSTWLPRPHLSRCAGTLFEVFRVLDCRRHHQREATPW